MSVKKILFLGTHGQYNIGDELLLETFLSQLGNQHEYTVNTYDEDFTLRQVGDQYKLKVFHTTQKRWHILGHILKNDLLFFGGGSILKELYASVGRNRYATLLMVLAIVSFAKIIGRKKIVMSNIGVGPIQSRFGLLLVKLILSLVDYVSVRDEKSHRTCVEVGTRSEKLEFVPDAVFVHNPAFFLRKQAPLQERSEKIRVALNLNYNIENPEFWDSFIQNLAEGFKKVHEQYPLEIYALPMQSGYKENNDLELLKDFQTRIPEIRIFLHKPATTLDMGDVLRLCDFVVAERLHTCISAAILGVPVLPLVYDVKVRELVKILGVESFGLEIDAKFSANAFEETFIKMLNQKNELKQDIKKRAGSLQKQLEDYFQILRETFL
ncbi:MAG: hypothetical protein GY755_16305 [Chloroflexi bacterium]|nr:hypothetical protein [Chloroflexota bacterium]